MDEFSSNQPYIHEEKINAGQITSLLLDIGSLLLASGAHSERINRNVQRIGKQWGYEVDIFFSFTGLIVTIEKKHNHAIYATRHKRIIQHGVNFNIINQISLLSWQVVEDSLTPNQVKKAFDSITTSAAHSRTKVLLGVGVACAALCMLAQGSWQDALIACIAAIAGEWLRGYIVKKKFNPLISTLAAALITSFIAGLDAVYSIGASPERALATSVLYLVPGVTLINSVIDLIEGYVPTAISRGLYGSFTLLLIAIGMSISIFIIGIHNFF